MKLIIFVSIVGMWCAIASSALAYHNCGTEPWVVEVVCEVAKKTENQSEWSLDQRAVKTGKPQVVCVSDGFRMNFTVPVDSELKAKIFVAEPTKLEVCIKPHP